MVKSKSETTLKFNLSQVDYKNTEIEGMDYAQISGKTSFIPGAPKVPFISVIVEGRVDQIAINLEKGAQVEVKEFLPAPAMEEACRCALDKVRVAKVNPKLYSNSLYKLESLGDFRGVPLTKVTLYAASTDLKNRSTTFYPEIELRVDAPAFNYKTARLQTDNTYLIIYPKDLEESVQELVAWKESQGFQVEANTFELLASNADQLKKYLKTRYNSSPFSYVLIVGTDRKIPMHKVSTSGSSQTPTDISNYQLGDNNDYIPDVFYGRIVAETNTDVRNQLQKFKDYADQTYSEGLKNGIGIASNEGFNPSDDQYVRYIEEQFSTTFAWSFTHFHQNDRKSNPTEINKAFNQGANWLTYMGHGSGWSWASTYDEYTADDIKNMRNAHVTKPIFIDVACMNGRMVKGYAGERLMNEVDNNQEPIGTTAYYGGTVNISWHPPAIMAKGMSIKTTESSMTNLSEIIFAGQMYLAENYDSLNEVIDNFEWYHIFGDPSLEVHL